MKVGDLVADTRCKNLDKPFDWLGIILNFYIEGDPVVQWFMEGKVLQESQAEFRKDVYIL